MIETVTFILFIGILVVLIDWISEEIHYNRVSKELNSRIDVNKDFKTLSTKIRKGTISRNDAIRQLNKLKDRL